MLLLIPEVRRLAKTPSKYQTWWLLEQSLQGLLHHVARDSVQPTVAGEPR